MDRQAQLCRQVTRYLENFRKLGKKNQTPAIVRFRIRSLKELWQQCLDGHANLERAVPEDTRANCPYFADGVFEDTETVCEAALDHMAEVLEELEPPASPGRSMADGSFVRSCAPTHAISHLPPIQLPPFDGDSSEWESFRDRFAALIIENRDLSDFTRMHFLVSVLRGRALECIADLAVTTDNFSIAWTALKDRYDSTRRLLTVHLSALTTLPQLCRESSADLQTLRGKVKSTVASLHKLNRSPENLWNDILVYLITQRLDSATRKAWNLRSPESTDPPSFVDLDRFLAARIRALEEYSPLPSVKPAAKSVPVSRVHATNVSTAERSPCPICKAAHFFSACPSFVRGGPHQRRELVKHHKRCFNCLSQNHSARECKSKYSCRVCQKRHHSLLHAVSDGSSLEEASIPVSPPITSSAGSFSAPISADATATVHHLSAVSLAQRPVSVLLATAHVKIISSCGRSLAVRALLDQGSEMTFVTERVAQLLRTKRVRMPVHVSAVGDVVVGYVRHAAHLSIAPLNSPSPTFATTALILKSLTSYAPKQTIHSSCLAHLADLLWADPTPLSSDPIDLIIGADIYGDVVRDGLRRGAVGQLIAQRTVFGWIISGPTSSGGLSTSNSTVSLSSHSITVLHSSSLLPLEKEIRRFWEVEELPPASRSSPEDAQCEKHFSTTHSRAVDGRYIVRLPFRREPPIAIGSSRLRAERVLASLSKRLHANEAQRRGYSEFLREYETLGHMRRVRDSDRPRDTVVFIPHHPVFRAHSVTTHLRVVFNASSPTSNGSSLNDHLLAGPKLQTEISAVILRWRGFRFVYSADVEKMYRQIQVDPRDLDYQRILWTDSFSPVKPIEFQLLTVTYGMSCAPYLALRVLQQLTLDEGSRYPLAVPILKHHIYVDDVLFGGDDLSDVVQARDQLINLLRRGRFELRKWSSNSPALLEDIDAANHGLACSKTLAEDETIKILGIAWIPSEDVFRIQVSLSQQVPTTKRAILSAIAKLYDPLGWVTPVTISAKILMQQLWREKCTWDSAIPATLQSRWQLIFESLALLNGLCIPRWTGFSRDAERLELHGFADASTAAYAAVVYLRLVTRSNRVIVTLLAAKSKVAPLVSLSIPRLELSAAVILARLVDFVRSTLELHNAPCFCWSDSTVVLSWLADSPSRWKVFVANRVADVQRRLPRAHWRHVPTKDNPADCASRGILGSALIDQDLWWKGPAWLARSAEEWPPPLDLTSGTSLEEKFATIHVARSDPPWELFSRFSSWPKLIRVTAYIFRFVAACRRRITPPPGIPAGSRALASDDCSLARVWLLRQIQMELFPGEIRALENRRELPAKSRLLSLRPFLDDDGLVRVGGRLSRAPLPLPARHPILLSSHRLTEQIVECAHFRALHAGVQLTLSILRREFWILRARNLVRSIIHRCVICVRERAEIPTQIMGDLPRDRVSAPTRSFLHCGLDYAGPVLVRASAGRGITSRKAYIALFICLASRAIHLELVSDYSSTAFLNAFSRFCARRGLPQTIYSDNGTTFVGAERELAVAYRSALRDPNFQNRTATDDISWRFIPPSAPHFGGLWEAGIKSVKYHVRRVLRNRTLTFEEFTTLLCNIEACLNSRPLAPLSDSLTDYDVLTPGHFLIGSALTARPEPSILDAKEDRLTRWQVVRQLTERFWQVWYSDYVNTLQQRSKWRRPRPPIRPGQLVVLRNPHLPPCKWDLARVVRCHPGPDGLVRVVTVRTAKSEFKRPIVKLCVLPIDCESGDKSADSASH